MRRALRALLLGLAVAAPAAAQQRPAADSVRADSARADSARRIAPVVVTALRAPSPLALVPFAVAVRDETDVRRGRAGLALDEALRGTGVQVDNRFNFALGERLSIRGFGARAQFGVRGVKVIVDGVPATMPDGQTTLNHVDLGALRRAEVVRGPVSSLYGNASGGVVQLESVEPPDSGVRQDLSASAGADGLRRYRSSTGVRAGPVGVVLDVARLDYDGYREWSRAENRYVNARLVTGAPGNRLRLTGAAVDYDAQNPGSLSDSLLGADRRQAFANNVRQQTGESGRHAQAGAAWTRLLGPGELELSGYTISRTLDNPIPNRIIALDRSASGARVLYRVAGPRVRLTSGFELDRQRDDRSNWINEQGSRGALTLDQRERVSTGGAFAQATLSAGARVAVLGGLRFDRARFAVRDALVTDTDPDDSGARTLSALSPTAGISLALGRAALYANVATAFETPTTTELANRPSGAGGFNPDLDPQRTRSAEVGVRSAPGAPVRFALAAYRATVRDLLVPFEVSGAPGRQFFRNAGRASHQGVEASVAVSPRRWLRADLAYTLTDATFEEYRVDTVSYAGNRLPGVSPHRVEGALTASRASGWFAGVESRWVSRIMVNDANSASSPAYTVTDLRAGRDAIALGAMHASAFVGVLNAFDATYNASVVINAFGRRYYEPAPGRSLYGGLSLGFGRR